MTFRIVIGCMPRVVTADRHHHRQSWIEKAIELQVSKGVSRNTFRTMTAIPSSALLGHVDKGSVGRSSSGVEIRGKGCHAENS